jgi:hypothetical protein
LRANSSNTRCWYSISVTNRAAWNSRSPFQPSAVPAADCHCASAATPVAEVSLVRVFLMSPIRRSCSEWKTWWIVVSAMFSLTRPSPAQKCASSISSSYATGGVAGLWSVSTGDGSALCAMSVRNGVSKCSTSAGTATGAAVSPSTRPVRVTYCGRPRAGPGMNLPYGSAAIIGMLVTSASTSRSPSSVAAWALTEAQVAMPVAAGPGSPPSRRPVETGRPAVLFSYSRRKTWCEACEV